MRLRSFILSSGDVLLMPWDGAHRVLFQGAILVGGDPDAEQGIARRARALEQAIADTREVWEQEQVGKPAAKLSGPVVAATPSLVNRVLTHAFAGYNNSVGLRRDGRTIDARLWPQGSVDPDAKPVDEPIANDFGAIVLHEQRLLPKLELLGYMLAVSNYIHLADENMRRRDTDKDLVRRLIVKAAAVCANWYAAVTSTAPEGEDP